MVESSILDLLFPLFSKIILFILLMSENILFSPTKIVLFETTSPDRSWEIVVKYEEAFIFGSHNMYAYYRTEGDRGNLFKFYISNDGKSLNESNYDILWKEDTLFLSFYGEEQEEEKYIIYFNDNDSFVYISN